MWFADIGYYYYRIAAIERVQLDVWFRTQSLMCGQMGRALIRPSSLPGPSLGRRLHPDEVVRQGLHGGPEVPQEDHEGPLRGGVPVLHGGDEHRADGGDPQPQRALSPALQAAL